MERLLVVKIFLNLKCQRFMKIYIHFSQYEYNDFLSSKHTHNNCANKHWVDVLCLSFGSLIYCPIANAVKNLFFI